MTEPNTALAGEMQEISFARSRASMATFNEERAPSRGFGRWGFVSMVEARDGDSAREPNAIRHERPKGWSHIASPARIRLDVVITGWSFVSPSLPPDLRPSCTAPSPSSPSPAI